MGLLPFCKEGCAFLEVSVGMGGHSVGDGWDFPWSWLHSSRQPKPEGVSECRGQPLGHRSPLASRAKA